MNSCHQTTHNLLLYYLISCKINVFTRTRIRRVTDARTSAMFLEICFYCETSFAATNGTLYPTHYICLLILITVSVTTSMTERRFSSTRSPVDDYYRDSLVLHCYKHLEIDIEKVMDSFTVKTKRRFGFLFATRNDTDDQNWLHRTES